MSSMSSAEQKRAGLVGVLNAQVLEFVRKFSEVARATEMKLYPMLLEAHLASDPDAGFRLLDGQLSPEFCGRIRDRDAAFFLDAPVESGGAISLIGKIRAEWTGLDEASRSSVWEWMDVLVRIVTKIRRTDGASPPQ